MNQANGKTITVNRSMTKMIIDLHHRGYLEDFDIRRDRDSLFARQDENQVVPLFEYSLIGQCFDQLTACYKYVHALELNSGRRGILVLDAIMFHDNYSCCLNGACNEIKYEASNL